MSHTYQPQFSFAFLHPRHWPMWIATIMLCLFAFIPVKIRDALAKKIALRLYKSKLTQKRRRIAYTNLSLCFPDYSQQEKEAVMQKNFIVFCQLILGFAELSVRSKKHLQKRVRLIEDKALQAELDGSQPVIFLVPHTYPIDYTGILFASMGYSITSMFKTSKDPFTDWLIGRQRLRYGGIIFERSAGIKPLLKTIKKGFHCIYLPDEDHGRQQSIFAPFFATQKATLPVLGRLAQLSRAKVVPLYAGYNSTEHCIEFHSLPALTPYPSGDQFEDTRQMNKAVEQLIMKSPEQYMWTLTLLKTRPEGEANIY